jgi:hypothetical protein
MSRINFPFFLIILLTACTPNLTLTPASTVTSSPEVSITPTIAATETPSIANAISPENLNLLARAGYSWDEQTGSLNDIDGGIVLTLQNGKWLDIRTGEETSSKALKFIETNGVDFKGQDVVILMREINGETQMYLPTINAWVIPIDIAASQKAVSKNDFPKTLANWKTEVKIDINDIPEITWDDFHSGRLFFSEVLAIPDLQENVRIPDLIYRRMSTITNTWSLSEYPNDNFDGVYFLNPGLVDRPILAENDGVTNYDAFKMKDPITGKMTIVKGQRYLYEGKDVILHMLFVDDLADPNSDQAFYIVQQSLTTPPQRITEPIVSLRPEDWCGEGGLGFKTAQPSICALQGYDNLDQPRDLLPKQLQSLMAQFDTEGQLTGIATETYPVGHEIFGLQQLPLAQNSSAQHDGIYYLEEDDPKLDELFPDKK